MDMSKYAGSAFITYDDVKDGLIRSQIAEIEEGQYGRPVITFTNRLRLSLNVTNTQTMIKACGAESDDWVGEWVELYPGTIPYQGTLKDSVLLRHMPHDGEKKPPPAKPRLPGNSGDMDDEIPF